MTQPPKRCLNRKCPLADIMPANLREAGHRLSILDFALDQVREAIYLLDGNARFIQVNGEACRELGYSREELLQMTVFDIDPDFTREDWAALEQKRWAESMFTLRARHRRKSGHCVPMEIRVQQFLHNNERSTLCLARNISDQEYTAELKRRYQEEFHILVENSPDPVARYDRNCVRIYVNPAFAAAAGKPAVALLGGRPSEGSHSPELHAFEASMREIIHTGIGRELELEWQGAQGRVITSLIRLTPELDEYGQTSGIIAVGRDISALKKIQRRLELAEAQAHIGHWEWDYQREESYLSAEVCRIFGRAADWRPHVNEVLAEIIEEDRGRVVSLLHEAYRLGLPEVSYSYRIRRANGEIAHLHSKVLVEYDRDLGNPLRLVGTTQDITELKNYEGYLHDLTYNDTLTGLPNRARLLERARQSIANAKGGDTLVGLMLIDLDRFKEVNDSFGHGVGDRVLIEFGERLRALLRDYDTISRLSGDEFALVLPQIRSTEGLERVAGKISQCLASPFRHGESEIYITVSIGIAASPLDADDIDRLLQFADAALSNAKECGRACHRFYTTDLTEKSRERLLIEGGLRHAVIRDELQLHYQPQIDLAAGRLVGAEALMRWRHPSLGQMPPNRFIPVAEETGLILSMGEWALETAFTQAALWNQG
ncbi:MAG TPA: diguanylate cyclase, partial [Rhodocyclaceae bacterium]|nr:diguanylate cyclase [Rhodocyclaceae bacterium]